MATIKGKWQWNNTITWPADMVSVEGVIGNNNFVSNENDYTGIMIDRDSLTLTYRGDYGGGHTVYQNGAWLNQAYRIIDFGETDITIIDNFYKLITQNAVPMTTIKGKWKWNDVLSTDPIDIGSKTQFTSNNQTYVSVGVYMPQNDYDNGMLWYDGQDNNNGGDVYTKMTGWADQRYKVMDFGYSADITIDVYNFILANATCLDYDTKMVSVNQLKTVYNKLNNNIPTFSFDPTTGILTITTNG